MVINVCQMANERNPDSPDRFVTANLPWLVGAGGLIVYLITLNRWVSLLSLEIVNQISGPQWQPMVIHPLMWWLAGVFKRFPEAFAPLALNVFAAICGAAILGLLARTIALIQSDTAGEARARSRSGTATVPVGWIPPVLA